MIIDGKGRIDAAAVRAMLRAKYKAPEWALFEEVGDATGIQRSRRADAVAMNLWPSRGMEIHGFEIKVSRADWVAERDNPAKAEATARRCDRWWIVAGNDSIVRTGELPPTWGLIVVVGSALRVVKEAPRIERGGDVPRGFVASLLRAAHDQLEHSVPRDEINAELAAAFERGRDAALKHDPVAQRLDALRESVDAFEKTSGVKITEYTGEHIGRAVRIVMEHGLPWFRQRLEGFEGTVARLLDQTRAALAAVDDTDKR